MSEHDSTCALPALPIVPGVEFRHVPEFPGYCVGSDGSLRSRRHLNGQPAANWRTMSPGVNKKGYRIAVISGPARRRYAIQMSRLLLSIFVGPPSEGMQACHNDGNPGNDVISNLRWDTAKANSRDRLIHGTDSRGEKSWNARFTESEVIAIRARLAAGERGTDLAREMKCPVQTIYQIKHRRNWRHI